MGEVVGRVLADRFRVEGTSRGTFGARFAGWDLRAHTNVALDRYEASVEGDAPPAAERIERLVKALRSLRAAAPDAVGEVLSTDGDKSLLVPVIDVLVETDGIWVARAAIEGELLERRLRRRGRVEVDEALSIGLAIASAAAALERAGTSHGAISPSCIVVPSRKMPPALLDGPILHEGTRLRGSEPRSPLATESLRWSSPSVCAGLAPTSADDAWSIATLLYELLTGAPAFQEEDGPLLVEAITRHRLEPLDSVLPGAPALLVELLADAFSDDESKRPASADALAERIRKVRAAIPSDEAPPSSGAFRASSPARGEPTDDLRASGQRETARKLAFADLTPTPTPTPLPAQLRRSGARTLPIEQEEEPTPGALSLAQARLRAQRAPRVKPETPRSRSTVIALAIVVVAIIAMALMMRR